MVSMRSLFAYFWKDQPRVIYFVICCCLVLLLACRRRNATAVQLRDKIVLPSLVLLVVFGNPVSAHILVTRAVETQSLRFFWLVPVSLFLAAATLLLLDHIPRRGLKAAAAVLVIPLLWMANNGLQSVRHNWQNETPNWYKVPQVVVDLCDYIMTDETTEEKSAAFCFPLNLWVRQYEPEIYLPFSWVGGENLPLMQAMQVPEGETTDLDKVARLAAEKQYSYIVIPREGDFRGNLETGGYCEVYAVDENPASDEDQYDREYVLYRLEERSGS